MTSENTPQEGWNYDNMIPGSRNVFIFRDTNHASREVQDRIAGALDDALSQKFFNSLFLESSEREYDYLFLESVLKNPCEPYQKLCEVILKHIRTSAIKEKKVYGTDSILLRSQQIPITKNLCNLTQRVTQEGFLSQINPFNIIRLYHLNKKINILSDRRSLYSAKVILKFMNERDVQNAGVIYGDDHYPLISREFRKEGVGHIDYYPGNVPLSFEDALRYVRKLK
jgi:hypothetical protein